MSKHFEVESLEATTKAMGATGSREYDFVPVPDDDFRTARFATADEAERWGRPRCPRQGRVVGVDGESRWTERYITHTIPDPS